MVTVPLGTGVIDPVCAPEGNGTGPVGRELRSSLLLASTVITSVRPKIKLGAS